MSTILLDARAPGGGLQRYVECLRTGFERVPDHHLSLWQQAGPADSPFTPWGRARVARAAGRLGAHLIHGAHLELPRANIPTVATIHDVIPLLHPESMPSMFRRKIFSRLLSDAMRRASAVIVPSRSVADDLLRLDMSSARIEVIHHAVHGIFTGSDDRSRLAARRTFAEGKPYIASISSTKPHKGSVHLSAIASAVHELTGTATVVVGLPPDRSGQGEIRIPFLDDRELRTFLSGADLFICTSLREGFGFPLLEAAASGVAVVCGPNVGVVEILDDAAVVIRDRQPQSWVDRIVALLSNDAERCDRAAGCQRKALARDAADMAAATADVYSSAIDTA